MQAREAAAKSAKLQYVDAEIMVEQVKAEDLNDIAGGGESRFLPFCVKLRSCLAALLRMYIQRACPYQGLVYITFGVVPLCKVRPVTAGKYMQEEGRARGPGRGGHPLQLLLRRPCGTQSCAFAKPWASIHGIRKSISNATVHGRGCKETRPPWQVSPIGGSSLRGCVGGGV